MAPSGYNIKSLYFTTCVSELLFHLPKLSKLSKSLSSKTKNTTLA